mmetsp:Transcript_23955/g.41253  ORF Transcript_23955/g.41253 Transcript_23955/m.41253 type:complete len:363 (+) Transcript_23955:474-1562(+)
MPPRGLDSRRLPLCSTCLLLAFLAWRHSACSCIPCIPVHAVVQRYKLLQSLAHEVHIENRRDRGPLVRVFTEHLLQQLPELCAPARWQRRILRLADVGHEQPKVGPVKRPPQGHHLIQKTPERPHVALVVVRLVLAQLRGEVVGRAALRLSNGGGAPEDRRDAEIAHLHHLLVLAQEQVLRLQVAVQDLLAVDVLQGHAHLHEVVQDLLLAHGEDGALEELAQVPRLRVLHHDVQVLAVLEVLDVPHDVRVPHLLQHLDLHPRQVLLGRGRVGQGHLLHHKLLVLEVADQNGPAERPFADLPHPNVPVGLKGAAPRGGGERPAPLGPQGLGGGRRFAGGGGGARGPLGPQAGLGPCTVHSEG